MELFEPYNLPFAVALFVLFALLGMQLMGAGDVVDFDLDADLDVDLDVDFEADADLSTSSAIGGMMSLIGLGKVPFLIWLAVFLAIFSASGVFLQSVVIDAAGSPLALWLAAPVAAGVAISLTGIVVRPLGAILPEDHTTAVGLDSLVRRDATISIGVAQRDRPARASVKDRHGHTHHVMVEPHDPDAVLTEGETVLLVRRDGDRFFAKQYENPNLMI